jgi:hypothetical protein
MSRQLDADDADSLAAVLRRACDESRRELARLGVSVEQLRAANESDHARLARDAEHAIARLSTDGQVLDHVRELVRFFKTA